MNETLSKNNQPLGKYTKSTSRYYSSEQRQLVASFNSFN